MDIAAYFRISAIFLYEFWPSWFALVGIVAIPKRSIISSGAGARIPWRRFLLGLWRSLFRRNPISTCTVWQVAAAFRLGGLRIKFMGDATAACGKNGRMHKPMTDAGPRAHDAGRSPFEARGQRLRLAQSQFYPVDSDIWRNHLRPRHATERP